mmetsp:Transcript_61457/g.143846  ORF Transcript_61457/g.143846 Transcript_61457/m.143846 type:complete len:216 (-) Transcript_61457:210-857(-)
MRSTLRITCNTRFSAHFAHPTAQARLPVTVRTDARPRTLQAAGANLSTSTTGATGSTTVAFHASASASALMTETHVVQGRRIPICDTQVEQGEGITCSRFQALNPCKFAARPHQLLVSRSWATACMDVLFEADQVLVQATCDLKLCPAEGPDADGNQFSVGRSLCTNYLLEGQISHPSAIPLESLFLKPPKISREALQGLIYLVSKRQPAGGICN